MIARRKLALPYDCPTVRDNAPEWCTLRIYTLVKSISVRNHAFNFVSLPDMKRDS